MSSFYCEHCGKAILDTEDGFITGCEHYPAVRIPKPVDGCPNCKKDTCWRLDCPNCRILRMDNDNL